MDDLISRQTAYEVLTLFYHHTTDVQHNALREALNKVPTADIDLSGFCDKLWKAAYERGKAEAVPSAQPDVPDTNVGDMISRQVTIKAFKNFLTIHDSRGVEYLCSAITMDGINKILSDLPSAERHGKWITGQAFAGNYYDCFVCNQCKKESMAKTDYCPNCGAKMDEVT